MSSLEAVRGRVSSKVEWLRRAKLIAAYSAPLYLMPLLSQGTDRGKCAYCLCLMFNAWVLDTIPAPLTSSLPFVMLPLLGVMDPDDIATEYINDTFLFILSVVLFALAVEGTNIYTRLSLSMLGRLGAGVKAVLTGIVALTFCVTTVMQSSATTLVVFPVVESTLIEIENDALTNARRRRMLRRASVIARIASEQQHHLQLQPQQLQQQHPSQTQQQHLSQTQQQQQYSQDVSKASTLHELSRRGSGRSHDLHISSPKADPGVYGFGRKSSVMSFDFAAKFKQESQKYLLIREVLLLSVVYTTTLGGLSSAVANPATRILLQYIEQKYSNHLNMLSWFVLCFPVSAAGIVTCWSVVFQFFLKQYDCDEDDDTKESIAKILEEKHRTVGGISKAEVFVVACTVALSVTLIFRTSTITVFGWQQFFGLVGIRETTCVFFIVLLFFSMPRNPKSDPFGNYFLEWHLVNKKVPWNVLFTYGGGLCMAAAIETSGLKAWLTEVILVMRDWNPIIVQVVLMLLTTVLTELNNDAATAQVLIPIACELAESSRVNPLYYSFPVAVTCSTGLLLPVASVPMGLVYGTLGDYNVAKVVPLPVRMHPVLSHYGRTAGGSDIAAACHFPGVSE